MKVVYVDQTINNKDLFLDSFQCNEDLIIICPSKEALDATKNKVRHLLKEEGWMTEPTFNLLEDVRGTRNTMG